MIKLDHVLLFLSFTVLATMPFWFTYLQSKGYITTKSLDIKYRYLDDCYPNYRVRAGHIQEAVKVLSAKLDEVKKAIEELKDAQSNG